MEGFNLEIFLDAGWPALTPEARLLDTSEGCNLHGNRSGIQAHHTELQPFANTPRPVQIFGVEIGSETEGRIIGEFNCLRLVAKAEKRCDRSESLFGCHAH